MGEEIKIIRTNAPNLMQPKPAMTPRAVPQIMRLLKVKLDREWNPDEFISNLREEYDFNIKTGKHMCEDAAYVNCSQRGDLPFCGWKDYLGCHIKTLEWREKDITEANKVDSEHMCSDEELQATLYVLNLAKEAVKKELGLKI